MNDTDVRDILARALPDHTPLSRVTRDSAVAAGRSAARCRRVRNVIAIVGVFCLVLIGATTASLSFGRGPGTVDSAADPPSGSEPPTPTVTESPSASPPSQEPSLPPITEPPAETAAVSAIAVVSLPSTEGTFAMTMFADSANPKAPGPGCTPGSASSLGCEVRTGPHGETLTIQKGAWEGTEAVLQYQVMVHRTDGVILSATVSNTASTNPSYEYRTSSPANELPPISTEQLVELLLTPGLDPP